MSIFPDSIESKDLDLGVWVGLDFPKNKNPV